MIIDRKLVIVDTGLSNLQSIFWACQNLSTHSVRLLSSPGQLDPESVVIIPGTGSFGAGMNALKTLGIAAELINHHKSGGPLVGICLGMQLLFESSAESVGERGLSLIEGGAQLLDRQSEPVPNLGWSSAVLSGPETAILTEESEGDYYFVHSYALSVEGFRGTVLEATHGVTNFAAAIHLPEKRIFATQFHPEKSSKHGLQLLRKAVSIV